MSGGCLTDQEWTDLAHVCNHFLYATRWADNPPRSSGRSRVVGMAGQAEEPSEALLRRREVARRVVRAGAA